MRWRVVVVVVLLFVAETATACGDETDELAKATDCLRGHDARAVNELPVTVKLAREHGSRIRSFDIGRNRLTVVLTQSKTDARAARKGMAKAAAAVDASRPATQARGRFVFWWAERPSRAARDALAECLR